MLNQKNELKSGNQNIKYKNDANLASFFDSYRLDKKRLVFF